jgi:Chlorite dismutase
MDPQKPNAARTQCFHFQGRADVGQWRVLDTRTIIGSPLSPVAFLSVETTPANSGTIWSLAGVTSNLRYTTATERTSLTDAQAGLGRATADRAALIPIRKTDAWWALAQDERHAIYNRSSHTSIGMDYLPAIARRLHHSRDLGEPFDFLTWFEFAAKDESAFDDLLLRLRATEEWSYVDREIDVRLGR